MQKKNLYIIIEHKNREIDQINDKIKQEEQNLQQEKINLQHNKEYNIQLNNNLKDLNSKNRFCQIKNY